jgi:two-component system sensor histidine kinase BaeS
LKLERSEVDIASLVAHIIERDRPQADLHRIDLRFKICPHTPTPLMGVVDPFRVDQMINNLLSNALRHTPEGGFVAVEVGEERYRAVVTIHDSGSGIPEAAMPHLFERFFRADRSRSRSEGGTGLGLAIARQLAEAHGGTLEAGNHPEGGAVFTLQLPLKPVS